MVKCLAQEHRCHDNNNNNDNKTVFIKRQIARGYKALRRKEEGKRQNQDKDDQLRRGKKVGFESTFEGWDTV